jgi:hypothetical protein
MTTSQFEAVSAVEQAIIAREGRATVDGVFYPYLPDADAARHALAVRAVSEAPLLCRLIPIHPPCSWCHAPIGPDDDTAIVGGRRVHNSPTRPCAWEYETGDVDPYDPRIHIPRIRLRSVS